MKYHTYETHFDFTRNMLSHKLKKEFTMEQYIKAYKSHKNAAFGFKDKEIERLLIASEVEYIDSGRPFYNINPNIIDAAKRMKVSNIDISLLALPKDPYALAICMPENYENISNILVCQNRNVLLFFVHRILRKDLMSFTLHTKSPRTLEEILNEAFSDCIENVIEKERPVVNEAIQLFALCKFLTDNPNELIEFDVINKVKGEYVTAGPERRLELENISRSHGKSGYNIGVSSRLIPNTGRLSDPVSEPAGTRTHEFAHIRTGHLHCVRCGTGKKDVKVMWFRPTIVNADKPFKSTIGE